MKHASEKALESLEEVLKQVRQVEGLTERKPGVFYRKTRAFLHFHEDPAGLFADLRTGSDWERLPVNTLEEQTILLTRLSTFKARN